MNAPSCEASIAPPRAGAFVHFSADVYLDAREVIWAPLEAIGAIRYDVERRLVGVAAKHVDVVVAIQRSLSGRRP